MPVPRVAAVHDLSGMGRCSLTAAVPILAAMGVQACPLPTAILSSQTGFSDYTITKLTEQMEASIQSWTKQQFRFDGIYTGFLVDQQQVKLTAHFINAFRTSNTLVLVDPVLGDQGELYPIYTPTMVPAVRELIAGADIITPNLTEACLLTDSPYPQDLPDEEFIWKMAQQLARSGPRTVIISGIPSNSGISNLAWLAFKNKKMKVCNRRIGGGYSGTGDILASILCGALLRGESLEYALKAAAALFEAAISDAWTAGSDPNEGIPFEKHLHLLI